MGFDRDVALPAGLELSAIRKAIRYIENELGDQHFIDLYLEQANIFSALVSMFGTKALDSVSNYEKHKHADTSQQRFPDLRRRGSPSPTPPADALESKGSKRPWAIQSHYNHEGWYIVWRYLVDLTATIEPGRKLVVWRVDVVYLREEDWKYESSRARTGKGGRTHTFGVKRPATRLKGCAVFKRPDIIIRQGKPVPINGGS